MSRSDMEAIATNIGITVAELVKRCVQYAREHRTEDDEQQATFLCPECEGTVVGYNPGDGIFCGYCESCENEFEVSLSMEVTA
jgi:hypothetical protein